MADWLWGSQMHHLTDFIKIGKMVVEIWHCSIFQNDGSLPAWIFKIVNF